jgi:hypothetical protein
MVSEKECSDASGCVCHTGTQGLNNFTILEVSIAVKFFTETVLLALCSNPNLREYPF